MRVRDRDGRVAVYPLTRCGSKYLKSAAKWYGQYTDEHGIVRRVPLATDKAAAQQKLAELQRRVERIRLGLHDPVDDAILRPLTEHLEDFR